MVGAQSVETRPPTQESSSFELVNPTWRRIHTETTNKVGVLSSHQKVVFRRQKRTTFDVRNSTNFICYVAHPILRAKASLYLLVIRVSNANDARRTVTHITTTSFSTTTYSDITIIRYFEYLVLFSKTNCCTAVDACQCSAAVPHTA